MTIYSEAYLPRLPPPDDIEWTLTEQVGSFPPMFGMGNVQRVRYGNARWRAKVRYTNLTLSDRSALLQFIAKVGTYRSFWLIDYANNPLGSFPYAEILSAQDLAAFWASSSANRAISTDVDGVRITKTGATASANIASASSVAVSASQLHVFQALFERVAGASLSVGLRVGSTQFATDLGSSAVDATMKRHVAACVTGGGGVMYPGWSDNGTDDTNWSTQFTYTVRQPSLRRAMYVDGGTSPTAQSGNSLYLKSGPISSPALLEVGDMVEIVQSPTMATKLAQIVRLTERLGTDSSGKGKIVFEPTLRFSVSDSALVIPATPRCRMIVVEAPAHITRPPGYITDLEFTCEEVPQ